MARLALSFVQSRRDALRDARPYLKRVVLGPSSTADRQTSAVGNA
jgi:hypothetical protein